MRRWMAGVALGLGLGAPACNRVHPEPAPAARGPDVLLVTIDTLRSDHVGAYGAGFARTPTLDGLATRGVRFETVLAPTPITLPSHASLLTATWPPRHGVRHNGIFELGDALPTVAERFAARGWATGAVVGAVVLRARHGLGRGFDHYDDHVGTRRAGAAGFLERSAAEVTDAALAWLATRDARPFFLWVHYYDPHLDHRAPAAFARALPGRPYDAEIAYVDHELGRLLEGMAGLGRPGEPLVAVTSDHGESLGEHGETSHGLTLYDAALRVPWVLAGPGVPAGRSVAGVVRLVDVAPTLLALAGAGDLPGADGDDLSPLLAPGAGPSQRFAYAETLMPQLDFGWAPLHALRTEAWLYVRAPRPELYDLARDPGQRHDLSGEATAAGPMADLDARVAAVLEAAGPSVAVALDDEARARLQALGYALPAQAVEETGLDPKDGLRHQQEIGVAAQALAEGRYPEAEAAARTFLAHAPRSARAHGLLATVLLHTGRPQEALVHADRAIALAPHAGRFAERAEIRLALMDRDGAQADFERAAALDADDPRVQMGLLWVRLREARGAGDFEAAAVHARRAFALAPDDPFVRLRVGKIWQQAGAFRRALESFEEAVRLRPDFAHARLQLALEYARVGRLADARRQREDAGEAALDPDLGTRLALALAAAGDPGTARTWLAELARRHPGDARVTQARARLDAAADAAPRKEGT